MIYLVGGARPNFMKIAALSRAFKKYEIEFEIVHTGQHYDANMDRVFFEEFDLDEPLVNFNVGSGPHGEQTGKIMECFERFCFDARPDLVFTVGDVNSTMAVALVAAKMHIPVAHQEAGMRSGDKKMPEEINRIVTDHVSDYLFPISPQDRINLYNEGIDPDKIFLVGDPMIDNLLYYSKKIEKLEGEKHILVEIHRPANVDNEENLKNIIIALSELSESFHVIFTMHPRTEKMIEEFNLWSYMDMIDYSGPMGYFDFMKYMLHSHCVITDSDGIQQETSVLDIPCVSIRDTTNIEYTVKYGSNVLVSPDTNKIYAAATYPIYNEQFHTHFPEQLKQLNDGNASERIAEVLNGNNL
jgi:UDP-N-acetylglucosamine 2-epimerase (non-hydrolysing)